MKHGVYKGKAIPLQASTGPESSRRLRLKSAQEGGEVVSHTHRPPLSPRKYSWYSFLLEVESTPELFCGRKDYVNEKWIEPATFRFVARCLNQLRHRVPHGIYATHYSEFAAHWQRNKSWTEELMLMERFKMVILLLGDRRIVPETVVWLT
jgi:hypothetical protein